MRDLDTSGDFDRDVLIAACDASGDVLRILASDGTVLAGDGDVAGRTDPAQPNAQGRNWLDVWPAEGRAAAAAALNEARTGARATFRAFLADAAGALTWWDSTVVPIAPRDGTPARLLVISRDVTDQFSTAQALERSVRLQKALIRATSEIVWHADVASGITTRNGYFEFTGRHDEPTDMDGWLVDVHPEDRDRAKRAADQAALDAISLNIEYRLRHESGTWRWVEDHSTPVKDHAGIVTDWVGILTDVHDRKIAQEALRKSAEHLRLAVEATGLGTWDVNIETGERDWSPELFDLMRLPRATVPGRSLFLDAIHPDDRARADLELTGSNTFDGSANVSVFRFLVADDEEVWIEAHERTFFDAEGKPIRRVGTMQDITKRKKAEHEVWLAAHTDALTGIANRALFQARLDQAVTEAEGSGSQVGLLLVDIDHFKEINDSLGHDAGDLMLRVVAGRISASVPPLATVGRLGGDEFGVIVPIATDLDDLERLACCLVEALGQPFDHGGREIDCSASLGWSVFPDQAETPSMLLKNADVALYAAKSGGRSRAVFFAPAMQLELERRLNVLRSARQALAQDAVLPFYQPKFSLETGRIVGFEALLRWIDASGLHSPGALREALDDPELSNRLGTRMLERVLADMQVWNAAGMSFGHVALNVASPEFQGGTYAERIIAAAQASAIAPGQLEIEVTERVLLDDGTGNIEAVLQTLHEAGVAIALDDFGTGYASLTHLTRFPVSWVKVDRSFISNLGRDVSAAAIVEAVIALAHRIEVGVIAEGIETEEQLEFLRQAGCDLGQGFLMAKPMSGTRVPYFLETWRKKIRGGWRPSASEPAMTAAAARRLL